MICEVTFDRDKADVPGTTHHGATCPLGHPAWTSAAGKARSAAWNSAWNSTWNTAWRTPSERLRRGKANNGQRAGDAVEVHHFE